MQSQVSGEHVQADWSGQGERHCVIVNIAPGIAVKPFDWPYPRLKRGYRRQPGLAGAGPDRAIARRFAEAAIRTFMARLACALVHPAGAAGPAGRDPPPTA